MIEGTAWQRGRFDARAGPQRILFGRMYEDVEIERQAFPTGARVFAIASAGCTALALSERHDVTACDINPVQLGYAQRRIAGAPREVGAAERVMRLGRGMMALAGWTPERLRTFVGLRDPDEQVAFFRDHLDTLRFRTSFDALFSITGLRAVYSPAFLDFLPRGFGAVLRGRMQRCFGRHPNASNPYVQALFVGAGEAPPIASARAERIRLVEGDAAAYLESCSPGSFEAFTLSNILDGARLAYRQRLYAAVRRAATADAIVVLRSFGEPPDLFPTNRAAEDRSLLWGVVDVRRAETLS